MVDASTTLEYPRKASLRDELPRNASVFITPNGSGAVLLIEDVTRITRLIALEAQYYRALLTEEWGSEHLEGNSANFWSGAGCRDVSTVMPYSKIMNHASTLAEQVQIAASQDEPMIRVWCRDSSKGSVEVHDVAVKGQKVEVLDGLAVYFDDGLSEFLQQLRKNSLPNETGGVLLGYYDLSISAVVVVAALPAPPDSISSQKFFRRGVKGLVDQVDLASELTSGVVGYIGEWHSHPQGVPASPSNDDLVQLRYLAMKMSEDGLPAVSLIVSDREMRFYREELV